MQAAAFQQRTGASLWKALEYPVVKDCLDQLCQYGRLVTDESGIRIASEDIAKVFISMNWHEQPEAAARRGCSGRVGQAVVSVGVSQPVRRPPGRTSRTGRW